MKALSIRPPWAHAIAHLGKRIENRTWRTRYRGPILVHASSTIVPAEFGELAEIIGYRLEPSDTAQGAIIAVANLVDCVPVEEVASDRWARGPFAWLLDDVRVLATPKTMKGKLGLWEARLPHPFPGHRQARRGPLGAAKATGVLMSTRSTAR